MPQRSSKRAPVVKAQSAVATAPSSAWLHGKASLLPPPPQPPTRQRRAARKRRVTPPKICPWSQAANQPHAAHPEAARLGTAFAILPSDAPASVKPVSSQGNKAATADAPGSFAAAPANAPTLRSLSRRGNAKTSPQEWVPLGGDPWDSLPPAEQAMLAGEGMAFSTALQQAGYRFDSALVQQAAVASAPSVCMPVSTPLPAVMSLQEPTLKALPPAARATEPGASHYKREEAEHTALADVPRSAGNMSGIGILLPVAESAPLDPGQLSTSDPGQPAVMPVSPSPPVENTSGAVADRRESCEAASLLECPPHKHQQPSNSKPADVNASGHDADNTAAQPMWSEAALGSAAPFRSCAADPAAAAQPGEQEQPLKAAPDFVHAPLLTDRSAIAAAPESMAAAMSGALSAASAQTAVGRCSGAVSHGPAPSASPAPRPPSPAMVVRMPDQIATFASSSAAVRDAILSTDACIARQEARFSRCASEGC